MSRVADAMLKRVGGRSGQGRGKLHLRIGQPVLSALSPAERCPVLSVDSKPLGVLDIRDTLDVHGPSHPAETSGRAEAITSAEGENHHTTGKAQNEQMFPVCPESGLPRINAYNSMIPAQLCI